MPSLPYLIGSDHIFIIAEIGKNFIQTKDDRSVEEYLENAKQLIDAAAEAGADAVKFQTHEVEDEQLNVEITSPHFSSLDRYRWVARNTAATPLKEFWVPLKAYCEEKGILFFSTPMSRKAAQKLTRLGVPFWKVGSADVQDYVLLDYITESKKPIIISTGMVSLEELDEVVAYLREKSVPIAILYCVSQYPCPPEYFNLATIELFREKYPDATIGFSDHSLGSDAALAAAKLGARIIEKHFTLSRDLWGPDHKVSMTPSELRDFVKAIRTRSYEKVSPASFYGKKDRELEGKENLYRPIFNKVLVAAREIPAGTMVTEDMVYAMRPFVKAKGLPSNRLHRVIGKRIKKSMSPYEPFYE